MALAVGVALLAALGSCAPGGIAHLAALADACMLAWPAALWIASACGTGRWLAARCGWDALRPWPAASACGACALAALDAAAGWAGLLSGSGSQAWSAALLVPGIAALALELRHSRDHSQASSAQGRAHADRRVPRPWWFGVSLGIAIPAMLVAAASEPGVLWRTEFGAYDALSYHLTLPAEWHARGGIATLGHCAYSGMPSWMEAAYLHIRALGDGRPIGGSSWFVSAQALHAALALVAALCTGVSARMAVAGIGADDRARATADAVACALVAGLPWLAVTGTLAYSESLMLCALACAMCVLADGACRKSLTRRDLLALACAAVAAFGAKPSASLLVALPLAVVSLLLWRGRTARARAADAIACISVAAALLSPWWIRNWLATGNPMFPFAESLFGAGAWTHEQAARFASAHGAPEGVSRWAAPMQQWIAFGWGEPPATGVAWRPLWSLMPFALLVAIAWSIARSVRARAVRTPDALCALMILVQVAAWLLATHLQSRFLLPTVVPGAVLVACAIARVPRLQHAALLSVAMLAWSAQPSIAFLLDGPDPRTAALWIGAAPDLAGTPGAARKAEPGGDGARDGVEPPAPANLVQAINALDPSSARVACIGLSATAWVRPGIALDWCSVWDRGAAARALEESGGDGRAALRVLAAQGWTHVAIDQVMLDVWSRSGWLDPILATDSVAALRGGGRVVWSGPQGALVSLDAGGTR